MRKKDFIWIGVLVVVGVIYCYYFTGSFSQKSLTILPSLRPPRHGSADVFPVVFTLNGSYRITSIKVVALEGDKQEPGVHALWHLISESNSVPTKVFAYGQSIKGMHPDLAGVKPEPLEPGVAYRIFLSAGNLTSEANFQTKALPPR